MTNILFFDTETTEDGKHLIDIGAVSEDGASIHTSDRNAFASFAAGYEYLCGHNILSGQRDSPSVSKNAFIPVYSLRYTRYLSSLV